MEEVPPTYAILNDLCRRAGISAVCRPVNEFGVFAWQSKKCYPGDKKSSFAPADASVFNVRQDVILFQPILRKLVNEANGTFLSVQAFVSSNEPDKAELLQLSLQYRSIIRACLENLQDEIMRTKGIEREELQNFVTVFYSVECIWHLCEILFIDSPAGNIVLPHLLEWIRFHFPKYERKAVNLLSGELISLESHPDYWETVIGSLLQGRIEVVRALLRLHSSSSTDAFKLADQSLKALPSYSIYAGVSITEFNLRWKHWLIDTQAKIDAKMFVTEKNVDLIMRLVVGEEAAWSEVQNQCEAWYELLAAWLLYTEPTIKSFELGQFAKRCISRMGVRDHMKHLDRVLLAAMEMDILQVIKEIQHLTENGWFVTHLTDLLYHAGRLDTLDEEQPGDLLAGRLRESFLLDYGTLLMGHNSLWQVGLTYLDNCPTDGLNTIELLLPRIELKSEARIQKIIREAGKRDLLQVVQSICKVQGVISLKRGRLGNALTWALKSQDPNFTSFLADKYLREYSAKGELINTDLLDNLGSCMLASDKLIFLGKYCEFHKIYQSGDYKEAAALLISLISSRITPSYFWVTLLTDAVPLLECDKLVLSSSDTFTLLHFLEEKSTLPELSDKIDLIRLALARNLGRALTFEAQILQ
ncbi:frount protein-related [Holotrichia oblita]|uniref:Frount protein-related n=1 Tax=Holotrichia oblita TaxID=644536 RepID=A0ACB9SQT6_HOLOL|nr:frount protein-related [Holotrichia oblita]